MQRESGEVINDMFEWLIDPCLDFVRKNTKVGHSDTYSKNFSEFRLHSIQVLYIWNNIVWFYFSTIYYLFAGIHQFQTSQSGALSHVHDWHVDDRDTIQGRRQWEQTYQELLHGKLTAILFFFIRKRVPVILWHMKTPQINSIRNFRESEMLRLNDSILAFYNHLFSDFFSVPCCSPFRGPLLLWWTTMADRSLTVSTRNC